METATQTAHDQRVRETQTAAAESTATSVAVEATAQAGRTATAQAQRETAVAQDATATVVRATADAEATAQSISQTATAQPTPTPTSTPTPTPEPTPQGTVRQSSTAFAGPDDQTEKRAVLAAGEAFDILGRADESFGNWLYVRTNENVEGFVYEPRTDHAVELATLEVIEAAVVIPTALPTATPPGGRLTVPSPGAPLKIVHIWPAGICNAGGGWTAYFEVKIEGGDGRSYSFYWDEELVDYQVKESEQDVAVIQRPGIRGRVIGTITVRSGGQEVSLEASQSKPDGC
jgi:hypothetical protein